MKKIITTLFTISLLFTSSQSIAAGDGYVRITPTQPTQTAGKIEVLEVFWYACPHCFDFEPYISKWLATKPDDVAFRRMPGIFRESWIPHAKAYYTAEKLGVLDTIHTALFDAIHKRKKKIHGDDAIKKFFVQHGVDRAEFMKIYESGEVERKVKQAYVMGQRYKLMGVPAVIVNGKYMISGSTAGSFENVLKVINQLVDKERASTGVYDEKPKASSTSSKSQKSESTKKVDPSKPSWTTLTSKDEMTGKFSAYALSSTAYPSKKMEFPYHDVNSWVLATMQRTNGFTSVLIMLQI